MTAGHILYKDSPGNSPVCKIPSHLRTPQEFKLDLSSGKGKVSQLGPVPSLSLRPLCSASTSSSGRQQRGAVTTATDGASCPAAWLWERLDSFSSLLVEITPSW